MNLVDKSYWENWAGRPEDFSGYTLLFHEVLIKYIGYDEGKRFLEIGCSPGRNLIYFNRTFGFIPSGIDFLCNFDIVEKNLKSHGIKEFSLYNEDFLTFELNKTYDVVGSFGFLEHFEKWEPVLDKIVHCTKKGGYIITSVPHFRYGQYFLRKLLTPDVFERHNISVMDNSK
jgi:SAM-dependent methyltransferase